MTSVTFRFYRLIILKVGKTNSTMYSVKDYDLYKSEYIRVMLETSPLCSMSRARKRSNRIKLPLYTWMIKNCPDKTVLDVYDWLNWAGVFHTRLMSQSDAAGLILSLQKKLGRPLMYDDFRKLQNDRPTIAVICKYWGSLNGMKRDLGLEIIQESMVDLHLCDADMCTAIKNACESIADLRGDKIIATADLLESPLCPCPSTLNTFVKRAFGMTLTEYIQGLGYRTIMPGRGLSRTDGFGEKFDSRFEETFSRYLQSVGLRYGEHYFRSVKYTEICGFNCGQRTCDYKIQYNGRTIYIEIAGVLCEFKQFYINNRQIVSGQSKEKYRVKLMEKEARLREAGVEYFILFPCDLSHDILGFILNGDYLGAKELVKSHYKNNIHWKDIDPGRGVEYDWARIGKDGQPRVVV